MKSETVLTCPAKYGNGVSGRISDSRLNLDFLLDERARELHMELVRRTD